MRIVFALLLLITSLSVSAQDYKKLYVTSKGDSIKPEVTRVRIIEGKSLSYVFPNYYEGINALEVDRRKRYLLTNMLGKEYTITRLSRVKVKKGVYNAIAAFKSGTWEYIINLEAAIGGQEIEILN